MDDENPPPSRPYRIRRSSSSLISSTTSPMFSAPPTPTLQPPPSPMAHHSRHRHTNSNNNNGAISQNNSSNSNHNNNNNFGPGDIDDDVQPSSSSSPFPPPSPRPRAGGAASQQQQQVVAGPSSSFSRNSGPQSPLSSPDSTFWGGAAPSPSPATHNSYRGGPSTPGGMCVVSSSTVDDVPPSPFSPAEDINNSNHVVASGSSSVGNSNNNASSNNNVSANLNSVSNLLNSPVLGGPVAGPSSSGNSGGAGNSGGIIASNSGLLVHHRISQLIVASGSSNNSANSNSTNNQQQQNSALISQLNQDVNRQSHHGSSSNATESHQHPHTVSASSSSSSQNVTSPTFNMSPLRNKIKKASSFERFSQAQAASGGNNSSRSTSGGISTAAIVSNEGNGANSASVAVSRGNGGEIISNENIGNNNSISGSSATNTSNSSSEQPISSLPLANPSNPPASSSTIISRLTNNWEPVVTAPPIPAINSSSGAAASSASSASTSSSSFRLSQNVHFGGDKTHIKIPSKKLAAKIASVFEQEQQLNEASVAASSSVANIIQSTSSAASSITAVPLAQQSQHHQQQSHGIQQSSPSVVQQSYLGSSTSASQGQNSATANANSTLSQMLNEAPAHHLSGMGSLMSAAEEQIMSHHHHHHQQTGVHAGIVASSHENLIRELSESPLNLTESSSNNHNSNSSSNNNMNNSQHHHMSNSHHSQSQSVLTQRNPVISSSPRVSLINTPSSTASQTYSSSNNASSSTTSSSSSTNLLLSKKIPLTPKQKLLHRIQSGTMSPPPEPQPQPPMHQQQQQQSPIQQQLPSPLPQQQQQQQQHQMLSLQHHQLQQPSPSPPHVQQLSQQLQQASISTALSTIQSTGNLQSVNLSLVQQAEQLQQQNAGTSHLILSSGGPHSPNSQLDAYSYDALLRAREDLAVQEALGKIIEDPNNVNNMSYDSPEMYAYCQTIMNDEIFANSGNAAGTQQGGGNNRQLQLQQSLQDPNDALQQQQQGQHQGQIEFVLGLSDEHDNRNVGRGDDMSLGGDGAGQQQFLDPNDLAAMKSHNQTDSTLRNLLMMDSSRYVASEDAWILADYQNRILSTDFNSRGSSSSIRNGMFSGGNTGSSQGLNSASVMSINGLPNNAGVSWNNDTSWQRTSIASSSGWQHHSGVSVDQDEVMDMSMMEPNKGNSNSAAGASGSVVVTKRITQLHAAAYGDQGMDDVNLVSDRDLATGLPLLQNMPISMAMDLQQPLGILQNNSGGSGNSLKNALLGGQSNGIPMDLQQHHKILGANGSSMDMDDQPVNLMAVNLEQELAHHSNSASVSHHHHHQQQQQGDQPQQHSAAHLLPHHLAEVKSLGHASGNSGGANDHSNQQGGSYTLQIHQQAPSQHVMQGEFHHSQQQQQHLVSVGNLSPILDNIDERRIIRVKKATKEGFTLSQDDLPSGLPPPNIIPDKPVQPKSHASLPAPLQLIKIGNSDDELAVFTRNKAIPPNTRFGPVEGSLKKACAEDMDTMNAIYPCLIISDHQNIVWRVDRDDDDCCNWTKFVRMAHSIKDQNALVSEGEHDGMLYFTTCKEILPRTELQVGFSFEYAQKYGLPYLLPLPNTTNPTSNGNASSAGGMLDDGKMSLSHFQQQQQQHQQSHSSSLNTNTSGVPTVIHGSQNFLHHQQQLHNMQKSMEEESLLVHQSHHNSHPPQAPSVSPETTSAVLTAPQQQTHQPQADVTAAAPATQQPQQKSVIVESYQCFECDQEFQEVTLLQEHLEKMHKEPEIRRPKKKAIKKYQQQLQQQQQNSAVSTTNNASTVAAAEIMDTSFSFAVGRDETYSTSDNNKISSQLDQSGKVDSSSQSNMVDSSDPLSMGNLPVTKKRKAASSMKALSASSAIASSNATNQSTVSTDSLNEDNQDGSASTKADTVVSSAGRGSMASDKKAVANSTVISGGLGFDGDSDNQLENQQMQVDGGNDSDVTASQPPAKVKCTMCYKSFATKERLDRHMIVHSDEDTKPLKCPFCPKRFLTNSALAGHIKTHAEEGKCFECPICNFSTQQLLQLKEHVQTHKNRDSGLFHCPQCPKKFSAYSMIRKHIRAFHGPRQYECEQCPMSFPTSDKLKLHKLKHSDHREFLCAECGRQFKRKDKLREHTKRIHETKRKAIELTLPKDKNIKKFLPKISPEEYERFIYKCSECMVGFKRRGMLVNHLAKRHPEKPPQQVPELNMPIVRPTRNYFCLYCDRVYKSSSKRKAHIMKAHPGKPVPPQARSKDIPQQLATFIDPQPLQPGTVVQTLTDDGNNTARAGVVSSNVTSSRLTGGTVSTSTLAAVVRRETVVGKVVAQPHGCQWCHRQYATRAKLLQHQRKAHIHLMPPDMQMPRTQKNNVMRKEESAKSKASSNNIKIEQESVISSNVASSKLDSSSSSSTRSKGTVQSAHNNISTTSVVVTQSLSSSSNTVGELPSSESVFSEASQAPSTSTSSIVSTPVASSTATTTATIQAIQAEGLPFQTEEGGLVGILVTQVGPNGEIGNLVQGDVPIVMLTTQAVGGSSAATTAALSALQGVNFSVLQTGQVANLNGGSGNANTSTITATTSGSSQAINNGTNASPNIISISSTNTNTTTTASLDNASSTGIITINTGSSGNNSSSNGITTVARNVIQHHQSSSTNNNASNNSGTNSEQNGSSSSSSSSSGVISTTGKL